MNRKNKGFTLAELLIIVVIIAVLVAISIPIFSKQLEKSREATDLANVRAAYAELMTAVNTEDKAADYIEYKNGIYYHVPVVLKQKQPGWTMEEEKLEIGGIKSSDAGWKGSPQKDGLCQVYYIEGNENAETPVIVDWMGGNTIKAQSHWLYSNGKITYNDGNYQDRAGTQVSAVTLPITKKEGESIELTLPKSMQKEGVSYTIGLFYVNPEKTENGYNVYIDSAEKKIENGQKNVYNIDKSVTTYQTKNQNGTVMQELESGQAVKVAVQFFKYENGKKTDMTQSEANALMNALKY